MTEPTTPSPDADASQRPGCGAMFLCLLVMLVLLWLFPHLGWWPRERGFLSGLAVTGTSLLGIGLTVALLGLWNKVRGR